MVSMDWIQFHALEMEKWSDKVLEKHQELQCESRD
jgi:hypothetical protein